MIEMFTKTNCDITSNSLEKGELTNGAQADVFISYSPEDYEKVEEVRIICDNLKKKYTCWFENFESSSLSVTDVSEYHTAIAHCRHFIIFFSRQYFNCTRCKLTLSNIIDNFFSKGNLRPQIIPILVDNMEWSDLDIDVEASLYGLTMNGLSIRLNNIPLYGKGVGATSDIDTLINGIYERINKVSNSINDELSAEAISEIKTKMQNATLEVFISYAHKDSTRVAEIYNKLKVSLPNCWWFDNEQLLPYKGFNKPIYKALKSCKCVIIFFSKNYAKSDYCSKTELPYACDKNIIPVFLDDADSISFSEEIQSTVDQLLKVEPINCKNKSPEVICENIVNTTVFKLLKSGLLHTDSEKIEASECILNQLVLNLDRQQEQKGNYKVTQDIAPELFSSLKKIEKNSDDDNDDETEQAVTNQTDGFTVNENNKERYKHLLPDGWKTHKTHLVDLLNKSKHLFLTGEGGGGKTTTLIETCRWLLAQGEYAVYIPLKVINGENNFKEYLEIDVFSGNSQMYHLATTLMKSDKPFYIFLDGLNEMSTDYIGIFINNLESFLSGHHTVKLIISSRFDSLSKFSSIKHDFALVEFQKLDTQCVENYIIKRGLSVQKDVLHLLHTPLMLTLYCYSEEAKMEYEKDPQVREKINLESNPNSAAKILHNYVQTQLYRAFEENTFNEAIHVTLLEYILPSIALDLVRQNSLCVDGCSFFNCVSAPAKQSESPKYFFEFICFPKNRKAYAEKEYNRFAACQADELAQRELAFIVKYGNGVSFTHQVFRDFFAAKFLCLEMNILQSRKELNDNLDLCAMQYSDDVLSFVADLQKEYDFEPQRDAVTRNWQFEKGSVTENILAKWQNVDGELAQTAVYNLFNILRLGRNGKLFSCDFPGLDLRACNLNGVKFSEFDKDNKDKPYASSFEGAWIDKECFLPNGHSAPITAMCISSDNILYTGDVTGKVFRWNLNDLDKPSQSKKVDPKAEFEVTESKIIRLALSEENKSKLLVLTDHSVTEFDVEHGEVIKNTIVPPHKYLRDVRDNAGVVEVTYDTAPLTWQALYDNKTDSFVDNSLPISGCIKKNPCCDVYAYSDINGQIRTSDHGFYSLRQHLYNEIKASKEQGRSLEKYYILKNDTRITDICWHSTGKILLVAYSNTLFEFAYRCNEELEYLKHLTLDRPISAFDYASKDDTNQNRVIVCSERNIYIFDKDENQNLFDTNCRFSHGYIPKIKNHIQHNKQTYLLSANNELKIFGDNLVVEQVRQLGSNVENFCLARNIEDGEVFLCLLIKERNARYVERFDKESDECSTLHTDFEFIQDKDDHSDKLYTHIPKYNKLISFHRETAARFEYDNYSGLYIQKCSFKNVQGNIKYHQEILIKNGGEL